MTRTQAMAMVKVGGILGLVTETSAGLAPAVIHRFQVGMGDTSPCPIWALPVDQPCFQGKQKTWFSYFAFAGSLRHGAQYTGG